MKEVTVIWKDSRAYGNHWYDGEETKEFTSAVIQTKGFLIAEDSNQLTVAQSVDDDSNSHNIMVIPKGCIKKIKKS